MNDDDITGIFDHLTPDDFIITDLSGAKIPLPDGCSFDEFVDIQITLLKYAFAACDGEINPLTILAVGDQSIVYQAADDESLGQYITRMAGEARRLKARWVFFYKKTLVAKAVGDATVGDDSLMQQAMKQGDAWEAMYWYAAQNDDTPPMRHGYVSIDNQRLGKAIEAPTQENELLGQILGS